MEQPIRLERFGSGFGRCSLEVQKCLITSFFKVSVSKEIQKQLAYAIKGVAKGSCKIFKIVGS